MGIRAQTWLLMLAIAIIGSNSLVLSPILSDVAGALSASSAEVARAAAAYGGATALSALFLTPWAARLGSGLRLRLALGTLAAALGLSALAPHWIVLALAQALAGAAAGVLLPTIYALATAIAPAGQDARILGRVLTGWSLSLVGGVPASAFITDLLGWRAVFLILAAIAGALAVGMAAMPSERPTARDDRRSFSRLLATPTVTPLLLVCLLFMTAFYGTYSFIGDHTRALQGLSAGQAGLLVLAYGGGFGAASLFDGLIDRLGMRWFFPLLLAVLGGLYSIMPTAAASFGGVIALCAAWGLANHFTLNMLILQLSRADAQQRNAVLGLNSAVTYFGAMIGAAAFGEVYVRAGFAPLGWLASGALVLAALIAALALRHGPATAERDIGLGTESGA